jgi:uncharacterized RDD family membrane protein YckC
MTGGGEKSGMWRGGCASYNKLPQNRNNSMSAGTASRHLVRRAVAAVGDYLVVFALTFLWFRYQFWVKPDATGNYGAAGCLLFLPILALWILYFPFAESRWGCTAGKLMFDLQVERLDGKRLSFGTCFKRHLVDPVDFSFYGLPGLLAVRFSATGQRLGDMVAETRVVLRLYDARNEQSEPAPEYREESPREPL